MRAEQEIRLLKDRIRTLSARIEQRPVVQQVSPARTLVIFVDRGNTLETGQAGIKYQSGFITSVPSAYDPNVTSSFIDGIGRGILTRDGVVQSGYVLIVNDDRGTFHNALLNGDGIITTGSVLIQVGSSGVYVTAYPVP